jgi:hypothetical protein
MTWPTEETGVYSINLQLMNMSAEYELATGHALNDYIRLMARILHTNCTQIVWKYDFRQVTKYLRLI